MNIEIVEKNGTRYLIINGVKIFSSVESGDEVLEVAMSEGVDAVVVPSEAVSLLFFDLKTRVAGEILQKFTLYHIRLAVTGDFSNIPSDSLRAFMVESNRQGSIVFVDSIEAAFEKLR